jgi:MoaA/NifB/PqqE/SkfB family radical SAM enzyme
MTYLNSKNNEKTIILMVNDKEACNASCEKCYLPYKGNRTPKSTQELAKKLISEGFAVIIAGSEILTNAEYLPAYKIVGQKYILSNGIILNQKPELFDVLKKYEIEEVRLSFDFSAQKEMKSVPKSVVEKVIKKALNNNLKVLLSTILTKTNYKDVENMCEYAYANGVYAIKFCNYIKSGSAINQTIPVLTIAQKEEFFNSIKLQREKYDKNKLEILLHGNFGPMPLTKGQKLAECNNYCPAGKSMFVISPDDGVYGCPFLMQEKIGELIEQGIKIMSDLNEGKRNICLTDLL